MIHPSISVWVNSFLSFSSFVFAALTMAGHSRWIKPEVYPLIVPVAAVVGLMAMQLVRNIYTNPEVRVTKQNRAAGVLDNFDEGERYSQHFFRRFVRGKKAEVMPNINKYFSDPK